MKQNKKPIIIAITSLIILAIITIVCLIIIPTINKQTKENKNESNIVEQKDVWGKDTLLVKNNSEELENYDFSSAFANPNFEKVIESKSETSKTAAELPTIPTKKETTQQQTQSPAPIETTKNTYSYDGGADSSGGNSSSNKTYTFGDSGGSSSSSGANSNYSEDGNIASTASSNSSSYGGYINSIVSAVNSYRGGGLSNDNTLNNIAMFRAAEAAASGNTSANRPNGKSLQNLAGYYGLSYSTIGNSIGLFDLNVSSLIAALQSSSGASSTVTNGSMSRIGVGIAPYGGNYIWVIVVSN